MTCDETLDHGWTGTKLVLKHQCFRAVRQKTWRENAHGCLERPRPPAAMKPALLSRELSLGARQALVELADAHLVLADHRASYPLRVLVEPALTFFDVRIDLLDS